MNNPSDFSDAQPIKDDSYLMPRLLQYDLGISIVDEKHYDAHKDDFYEHTIILAAQEFSDGLKNIAKGKVNLKSVYGLIADLVKMAESIFKWSKAGPIKFKVVMNVINKIDGIYHFKAKIADVLPLPFPLTVFRKKIADLAIYITIQAIVFAYNEIGW